MATTPTPQPTTNKSPASPTPAGTDTKTVNVSLPSHIHAWFVKQAEIEERTLSNYVARALKLVHADAHKDVDQE